MGFTWPDGKGAVHSIPYQTHLQNAGLFPASPQGLTGAAQTNQAQAPNYPAAAAAAPPAPAAPNPVSPLDAQFFGAMGTLQRNDKNQIDDLGTNNKYLQQDHDTALSRLAKTRADSLMNTDNAENKAGLFYSGHRAMQRDNVNYGIDQQVGDSNNTFQRGTDANNTAIQRIRQNEPLQLTQLAGESMGRVLQNAGDSTPAFDMTQLPSGWRITYANGKPSQLIAPGA